MNITPLSNIIHDSNNRELHSLMFRNNVNSSGDSGPNHSTSCLSNRIYANMLQL